MSTELALNKSEKLDALAKRGEVMLAQVHALEVKDESGRAIAAELREQARLYIKGIKDDWKGEDGEVTTAYRLYKSLLARVDRAIEFPEKVIKITEGKMSAYQLEEDRKHQEEQAKIDADTKRKEDAEKERLLKLAVKQAESGNEEKAEATLQRAEEVAYVAPVLPSIDKRVVTEAGGTSSRKDFDITVVEPAAVFAAVVRGALPPAVLEIKMGPLKKYAEMNRVGDTLPVIPGCRLVAKFTYSGRAK
jgi:hypothetical protein